jgi:hypothetical protein
MKSILLHLATLLATASAFDTIVDSGGVDYQILSYLMKESKCSRSKSSSHSATPFVQASSFSFVSNLRSLFVCTVRYLLSTIERLSATGHKGIHHHNSEVSQRPEVLLQRPWQKIAVANIAGNINTALQRLFFRLSNATGQHRPSWRHPLLALTATTLPRHSYSALIANSTPTATETVRGPTGSGAKLAANLSLNAVTSSRSSLPRTIRTRLVRIPLSSDTWMSVKLAESHCTLRGGVTLRGAWEEVRST